MDVYKNEQERQKYLERYYTKEGVKALETRLNSLIEIFLNPETNYPFSSRILGFPLLVVKNKEQHEGAIEELKQILAIQKITVTKRDE